MKLFQTIFISFFLSQSLLSMQSRKNFKNKSIDKTIEYIRLLDAIQTTDVDRVANYLHHDLDLNRTDFGNQTILDRVHKGAMNHRKKPYIRQRFYLMASLIVKHGGKSTIQLEAEPSKKTMKNQLRDSFYHSLHGAIRGANLQSVRNYLNHGYNPNETNYWNKTALDQVHEFAMNHRNKPYIRKKFYLMAPFIIQHGGTSTTQLELQPSKKTMKKQFDETIKKLQI